MKTLTHLGAAIGSYERRAKLGEKDLFPRMEAICVQALEAQQLVGLPVLAELRDSVREVIAIERNGGDIYWHLLPADSQIGYPKDQRVGPLAVIVEWRRSIERQLLKAARIPPMLVVDEQGRCFSLFGVRIPWDHMVSSQARLYSFLAARAPYNASRESLLVAIGSGADENRLTEYISRLRDIFRNSISESDLSRSGYPREEFKKHATITAVHKGGYKLSIPGDRIEFSSGERISSD